MRNHILLCSSLLISSFASANTWTNWLNRDLPGGNGEYETRADFPAGTVCAAPSGIEARYNTANGWVVIKPGDAAPNYLGGFSPAIGLYCVNADQAAKGKPACIDYQVRFNCGPSIPVGSRTDLSEKYPALKEIDKQNAEYSKTSPAFSGRNAVNVARASQPTTANAKIAAAAADEDTPSIVESIFHLGQGFDTINATYRSQCLNQSHPDFKILSDASNLGSTYSITHVKSHVELYEALDSSLNLSASTGFQIDSVDISAGIGLTNSMIKSEYLDTSHEVFVAKYTNLKKRYTLKTQPRPIKQAYVDAMIKPNQESYKRDFFSECGDRYVDGVELGANMYVVFYFDTKLLKTTQKNQAGLDVNLAIGTIFKGNLSQSQITQVNQTFSKYKVKFDVYNLGGPDIVHTFTDPTKFAQYLETFANGIVEANLKAVEEFYREYTLPQEYSTLPYFSVFANTNTYINYASKYTALMNEFVARCNEAKEYNQILGASFDLKYCSNNAIKGDIGQGRRNCGVSNLWDNCIHPRDFTVFGGALLMDKLAANTPDFTLTEKLSATREQSVTGGVWNKKCISDAYSLCLPANCHENKPESDNNQGYKYHEYSYHSPASSDEQGYKRTFMHQNGLERCVKQEIKACTHRIGGSKANFKYALQIWGVCPTTSPFPMD